MENIYTEEFIFDMFVKTGALLKGHFKLSSGLHSDTYLQCAKVSQYPHYNTLLAYIIASQFRDEKNDVVIGPALGGIALAYQVARELGIRSIFAERDKDKKMALRRGFSIEPKERVLVVEDVITTGASIKEIIKIVQKSGGKLIGVASIVNRSNDVVLAKNQYSILNIEAPIYKPEKCPLCQKKIPITSPGSKHI
ncbi:MAG: orotate phosphoribosyltransferase [Spirochaetes bacterium]|nr:orotate phosphoribosyltransferase [Spirochaetota bacterium]